MEAIGIYRQDKVRRKLDRDLELGRLASSLIFHGLPGLGKERMAFYLAQSILCLSAGSGACGTCRSCRKIERLLHPDVFWAFPRPGSLDDGEFEEIISRKGSEDFFRPGFAKTASHSIDVIRQLRSVSSKHPYEGRSKVFILTDSDEMTVEAANAFLKLLEEPPEDTIIIMTTSRPFALLPTIRSRCEEIRFSPLAQGDVKSVLVNELGVPPDRAEQLSRYSEGSIGMAMWINSREGKDGWDDAWEIFGLACRGSDGERYAYAADGSLRRDRERLKMALDSLVPLLHDVMAMRSGLGRAEVVNISRYDLLKTCSPPPFHGAIKSIRLVDEIRRLLDRNINASILIWRLLHGLSTNMQSAGSR
jgi:DNA polymerase-3 subunit delta'